MIKPTHLLIDSRLRSLKFMKNVTLDARRLPFLPNSENGPQEQVYRLKFVYGKLASTAFNIAFPIFKVPFGSQMLRPLPLFCAIGILKSSAIFRCFIIMFIF